MNPNPHKSARQLLRRGMSRREMLEYLLVAGAGTALAACGKSPTDQAASSSGSQSANNPPAAAPQKPAGPTATPAPAEKSAGAVAQPTQPPAADASTGQGAASAGGQAYLSVARGENTAAITEAAIKALGGLERFMKAGANVIIKPNICTDFYSYEYGATTNPVVVATLVKLAFSAGAKRVRVMDFPFGGTPESAYANSGIAEAVKAAGGEMEIMNRNKFKQTKIPQGKSIKEWEIYQDVLTCDLLIDVGIAKHHSLARFTAAEKNLLGVIQNRNQIHAKMGQRIADLLSVIKPGLTVVDAVRTLMRNGPTGGSLDDVKINNMVIASHDTVACDTYAAGLFNLTGEDIPYIKSSAEMGLGTMDLKSVKVEEITA